MSLVYLCACACVCVHLETWRRLNEQAELNPFHNVNEASQPCPLWHWAVALIKPLICHFIYTRAHAHTHTHTHTHTSLVCVWTHRKEPDLFFLKSSEAEERFAFKSRSVRVLCSSPALFHSMLFFFLRILLLLSNVCFGDMIEKLIAICSMCHFNITVFSSASGRPRSSDWKIITLNTHGNANIQTCKQACYLEKIYRGCSEPVFKSPSSAHQTELIAAFPVFGMLHFLSEPDAEEGGWWEHSLWQIHPYFVYLCK